MTSYDRFDDSMFPTPSSYDAQDREWLLQNHRRHRGGGRRRKERRKAQQLCRQVAVTLELVLTGECREELLQSLHVTTVTPAPNTARLLVTVSTDVPCEDFEPWAILALLQRHSGRLRAAVAEAIHRRRAPALAFQVLSPRT